MSVLLVGSGVAAAGFLHHRDKFPLEIDHVASPTVAPPCSWSSTAVAALRGTQKGLSPLGDELVEGWREAEQFFQTNPNPGAEEARHYTLVFDSGKNLQRFSHLTPTQAPLELKSAAQLCVSERAWIIRPREFLAHLRPREAVLTGLQAIDGQWEASFLGGEKRRYSQVVLASGQWMSWMAGIVPVPKLRAVQGSYYQWQNCDWGTESFSLSIDETNIVYHAPEQRLLLGATSVKDETGEFADASALEELHRRAQEKIRRDLPAINQARVFTGIRSLSKDRAPFALNPLPGLHLIGGLYKNGWVMAWRLGRLTAERF